MLSDLAVAFASAAFAEPVTNGHGHKTPHGGIVREAEGIHTELVIDKNGEPRVYLYDKAMKPLAHAPTQARLVVKSHNGEEYTRELGAAGNPKEGVMFKGDPIKGLKDWDTAVVSLKLKDSWKDIRFSHHSDSKEH